MVIINVTNWANFVEKGYSLGAVMLFCKKGNRKKLVGEFEKILRDSIYNFIHLSAAIKIKYKHSCLEPNKNLLSYSTFCNSRKSLLR